ncbi:MAG: hypothetical protein AAF846_06555 [Chloroflexota bacterium]
MRYIRTFFKALQMTMRGETITPAPARYPNLQRWLDTSQEKLKQLDHIAHKNGFDEATQKAIILELDGRSWSVHLILSSVKFHLETEFPSLMNSVIEHNLTTLYALHFDDKYRVSRLAESDEIPPAIRPALRDFATQFINIPPSTDP